uniref:S8 family serine peptidase n=1 Tax=Paractinoplanes polyasparticus TaxID=2856853 RepID=UPI001C8655CB|nr:S8 family serine peptidase [Actinoplanes polyasparticus]
MAGGLAAFLVLSLSTSLPAGAAPAAPDTGKYTVTLITGDRVTVGSAGALTGAVQAGAGRRHISFALSSARGRLMVIPSDAAALIRAQRVDQRLFDVTELISLGYDDARQATVPLILRTATGADAAAMTSTLSSNGARKTRDLKAVGGAAVTAPKKRIGSLWKAITGTSTLRGGVQNIWLDGKRQVTLDHSVPQIGAPAAWRAGYQGEGMAVAVLDTGVDDTHPDLAGRVTSAHFTTADNNDHIGHGTHVAATIAGDGAASNGTYRGVAPKASILSGKVCDLNGCPDSAILAGMQWAAVDQRARVINMSLSGLDDPGTDPVEEAVDRLTAETGALFVIAAGNTGDGANTIGSPGTAATALTVGAVDKTDRLAPFSSRGPRRENGAVKPDITAPGVDIVAARAAGTDAGTPAGQYYTALTGTSMATPHVAGSAILLAQQHPDWKAGRLKATLMSAAEPQPDGNAFQQGAGRVDVERAITQTVTTEPSSVSFGLQKWPHDNDQPISRTVTYHNDGDTAVTLDLAIADPAFSLDTSRVTVPAGGSAPVTLTADTRGDVAFGQHAAQLRATAGSTSVVTPVGIEKETESYQLTLKHVALDGRAAPNYLTQIFQPDGDYLDLPYDPSGTVTLRVPAGRYTVGTYLDPSSDGTGEWSALIFQPVLDITRDTTVVFDARDTTKVSQAAPDRSAETVAASLTTSTPVGNTLVVYGNSSTGFEDMRVGHLGDPMPFTSWVSSAWVRKDTGEYGYNSPYAYFLAEEVSGATLLAGYARTFRHAELATSAQIVHPAGDGDRAYQWQDLWSLTGDVIATAESQMHAPGTRTNYFSTGAGLSWEATTTLGLRTDVGVQGNYLFGERRTYTAGRRTQEHWGKAPFGTALGSRGTWFERRGAEMRVIVPSTGDASGHPGYDLRRPTTSTLYRGDALIASEDSISVYADQLPATTERYRVHQSSTGDIDGLATKIDVTVGFSSAADQTKVPVIAVRATPTLDADNTAQAGHRSAVPLTVLDQAGRKVTTKSLTADFSFDDGTTWQKAPITDSAAQITYPSGKGFVSLRLHATDAAGTTFDQSVIRAYRFG